MRERKPLALAWMLIVVSLDVRRRIVFEWTFHTEIQCNQFYFIKHAKKHLLMKQISSKLFILTQFYITFLQSV